MKMRVACVFNPDRLVLRRRSQGLTLAARTPAEENRKVDRDRRPDPHRGRRFSATFRRLLASGKDTPIDLFSEKVPSEALSFTEKIPSVLG